MDHRIMSRSRKSHYLCLHTRQVFLGRHAPRLLQVSIPIEKIQSVLFFLSSLQFWPHKMKLKGEKMEREWYKFQKRVHCICIKFWALDLGLIGLIKQNMDYKDNHTQFKKSTFVLISLHRELFQNKLEIRIIHTIK